MCTVQECMKTSSSLRREDDDVICALAQYQVADKCMCMVTQSATAEKKLSHRAYNYSDLTMLHVKTVGIAQLQSALHSHLCTISRGVPLRILLVIIRIVVLVVSNNLTM